MSNLDFKDLNVPGLLGRYSNPSSQWRATVLALARTQLELFQKHGLIKKDAAALRVPLENAVVMFSDYTPQGQAFLRSGAVDKWLASCDRKGTLSAYEDPAPLERRILKFLGNAGSSTTES